MFNKINFLSFIFLCFFIFLSCQKNEFLDEIVFDNSLLNDISFIAEKKEIKISYDTTFDESYIDHVMIISPAQRINSWLENNINNFGTFNKIVIDINKASITRKEIDSKIKVEVAGISKEKKEYMYELNFKVLFLLYNDSDQVLAFTEAEVYRSTTSSLFISLNERNRILDNMTLNALIDLSNKSVELLKKHMSEYTL